MYYKENDFKIQLKPEEELIYRQMIENEDRPFIFEYKEDEYSKYCGDCKAIIGKYVESSGLESDSVNRIFEKYFMYVS